MKTPLLAIEYFSADCSVCDVIADIKDRGGRVMFGDELVGHFIADANFHPVVVRVRTTPSVQEDQIAFLCRDQKENHILLGTLPWEEFLLPVRQSSLFRKMEEWFDGEFAVAVMQK